MSWGSSAVTLVERHIMSDSVFVWRRVRDDEANDPWIREGICRREP